MKVSEEFDRMVGATAAFDLLYPLLVEYRGMLDFMQLQPIEYLYSW